MQFTIAALLVASAAAFAPVAPVVTRSTSLGYSITVYNEDEGIEKQTFECADDVFLVGELSSFRTAVNYVYSLLLLTVCVCGANNN